MTQGIVLALLLSVALQPILLPLLRRLGMVDVPSHRSSHTSPVPRGGGVAVVVAVVVAVLLSAELSAASTAFLGAVVAFGVLGLIDDKVSLSATGRLTAQLVLACLAVAVLMSGVVGAPGRTIVERGAWATVFVAVLVAYTNAFNFMDGVNGISALNALVSGGYLAALALAEGLDGLAIVAVVLAAAAAGFLPWNFPRARVFLGDVGAYALGAGLALVAVGLSWSGVAWWLCVAPFVVYLADTGVALVKRLAGRRPWREAHREHVYQQIFDAGGGHVAAALLPALATVVVCCVAFAAHLSSSPGGLVLAVVATVGVTLVYLALPRLLQRSGSFVGGTTW